MHSRLQHCRRTGVVFLSYKPVKSRLASSRGGEDPCACYEESVVILGLSPEGFLLLHVALSMIGISPALS